MHADLRQPPAWAARATQMTCGFVATAPFRRSHGKVKPPPRPADGHRMEQFTTARWRRYGKDRLYVSDAAGVRVGWVDLLTGGFTLEQPHLAGDFESAVADWRAQQTPRPPRSRPLTETPVQATGAPSSAAAPGITATEAARTADVAAVGLSSAVVENVPPPDSVPPDEVTPGWADLASNVPGQAARKRAEVELAAQRDRSRVLSFIARAVDAKTDERNWRVGADGEETVGGRLEKLRRHGWHVLHAVPVGKRDSDIDHVLIGHGGVYTLNTKNHKGKSVGVGRHAVWVDGHRQQYLRNSRFEADRASRLLSQACGFPVVARAGLVFLTGTLIPDVTIKQQPDDVLILDRMDIPGVFKRAPRRLTPEQANSIFEQARRSTTWRPHRS